MSHSQTCRIPLVVLALAFAPLMLGQACTSLQDAPVPIPAGLDGCPDDSEKDVPGICGCGNAELPGCEGNDLDTLTLDLGSEVVMEFLLIQPGTFTMGSEYGESHERPVRRVTISRPFYMGKYEVTQAQWQTLMGNNPSWWDFDGQDRPVEMVSWDDSVAFCQALSDETGREVRLPTEAEWEYACRAGSASRYYFGNSDDDLSQYAWYAANSGDRTHEVGGKLPNGHGLYDMYGNVMEYCSDWYGPYQAGEQVDPTGISQPLWHVIRGGSLSDAPRYCRSAHRNADWTGGLGANSGFRVVIEAD